jgi:hypothetical protein
MEEIITKQLLIRIAIIVHVEVINSQDVSCLVKFLFEKIVDWCEKSSFLRVASESIIFAFGLFTCARAEYLINSSTPF